MASELWRTFHGDEVEEAELVQVISRQLGGARQVTPNEIEYLRSPDEAECSLRLIYNRAGLAAIEPGADLRPEDVEAIRRAVEEDLLASEGSVVSVRVLFSAVPVLGWWRYRDRFFLHPVPAGAPTPGQLLGAHPFVLELKHPDSPDVFTRMMRRDREARIADLILGSFLARLVRGPDGWGRQFWVYLPREGDSDDFRTAELQEGYNAELTSFLPDFSSTHDSEPLEVVVHDEFFSRLNLIGIRAGEGLRIPSSLADLLDAFYALQKNERSSFLRHAYWLRQSSTLWHFSHSASFVALINAVEALLPESGGGPPCPTCNRPQGPGPTRLFRDFVDTWAPSEDGDSRKTLYAVRSSITHGSKLLRTDLANPSGLHPEWTEEWANFDTAQRVARVAGVNWLLSQSKADA